MQGKQKIKNTCVVWLWFGYELKHIRPYFLHNLLLSSGKYVNSEWKIQEWKWYRRINHSNVKQYM